MVNHYIPETLHEALTIINEHECKLMAGGTDLMIQYRSTAETPPKFDRDVCYLSHIKELKYIKKDVHFIHIGAMTTYEELLQSRDIPMIFKNVIKEIASPGIRHTATLAGNIGNASPAGDSLLYLYAMDALVCIESMHEKRMVPIQEVITGPRKTIIKSYELIKEIIIPVQTFTHESWIKVGPRKENTISKISFLGLANIEHQTLKDFRIAFGAVYMTVVRKNEIEQLWSNQRLSDISIDEIITQYEPWIKPIDDHRSNRAYRKQVALNLLKDFLIELKGAQTS